MADTNRVRISFAAHMKPAPVAGFINLEKNSAISMSKLYFYRIPKLVKNSRGWYIAYSYRIPTELRKYYQNKEWYRFRVTGGMNWRKGAEREEYSDWLLTSIAESLKNGYNPFYPEAIEEGYTPEETKEVSARDALTMFLEKWKQRGLEPQSFEKYNRYVSRLMDWMDKKILLYNDIRNITTEHIELFLSDSQKKHKSSNRERNNIFDFIRTAFNYLVKKGFIERSPCAGIDKLKSKSHKHRYYDEASLKAITRALLTVDQYTYLAFQTIYYLCVRSDKELMMLKVGNILWEQNKVLADAEGAKGSSARYIPLDKNIKEIFIKHGINKYPADYFVFGIEGKPAAKPFGRGFFAKRFGKVRKQIGMSTDHTLYAAKHTRVIHLKQSGGTDSDIMSLTGHTNFVSYAKYLRDLGMAADAAKINKISRKI